MLCATRSVRARVRTRSSQVLSRRCGPGWRPYSASHSVDAPSPRMLPPPLHTCCSTCRRPAGRKASSPRRLRRSAACMFLPHRTGQAAASGAHAPNPSIPIRKPNQMDAHVAPCPLHVLREASGWQEQVEGPKGGRLWRARGRGGVRRRTRTVDLHHRQNSGRTVAEWRQNRDDGKTWIFMESDEPERATQ